MIGQKKILEKLNNYTLDTLPRTIGLFGPEGSGRHTLVMFISNKFNLPVIEVTKDTEEATIIEYQRCVTDKLYVVNVGDLNEKNQNKFLKFIEEPGKHVYIVLLATSEIGVLETILNRCMKFKLENYSKEDLKKIRDVSDERVYDICKTPGQLITVDTKNFDSLIKLCETIVEKIDKAPYSNTLSISQKVNYKEEYDKYDFNLFLNALEYVAFKTYVKTGSNLSYKVYNITNDYKSRLLIINNSPIKENYIINFLSNLWDEVA